jgi:predicted P-loop ATPase
MTDAINVVAEENAYDPLQDYLNGLVWDGKSRLATWLSDVYGAPNNDITAEFGKRWLISGIARGYKPGAKVRNMLLLVGNEDIGKSMSLCDLCPNPDWFSDYLPSDLHSKEAAEALFGKWIIESAELASIRRSQQEAVKAFLSRNDDNYRAPYERRPKRVQRRCILAGTTNEELPIPYEGEGTRYWPVRAVEYNRDYLLEVRDQLWAEAKVLYQAGQNWWVEDETLLRAVGEVRDGFDE